MQRILLVALVVGQALGVTPPLKDGQSDKKFFASNYPQDTRPVVDKNILAKVKTDAQPYPALQSSSKFADDFVKDENKDAGHWKAQFEYDNMRKKVQKEEADEKKAKDLANKEGKDVEGAQKKADEAAKKADEAKKDADGKKKGEDDAKKKGEGKEEQKTDESSKEEMQQKLVKAEENYAEQKKVFAQCKQDLETAKEQYTELKAKVAEMEKKNAADVKLWVHESDAKLKASKFAMEALSAKREAAGFRLTVAENTKAHAEKELQKEKAESEQAQQNLKKETAEKVQAQSDLEKASQNLAKLRGFKGGAVGASAVLSTAVLFFFL